MVRGDADYHSLIQQSSVCHYNKHVTLGSLEKRQNGWQLIDGSTKAHLGDKGQQVGDHVLFRDVLSPKEPYFWGQLGQGV